MQKRATGPRRLPRLQRCMGFEMPPFRDPILVRHVGCWLGRSRTRISAAMPYPDYVHLLPRLRTRMFQGAPSGRRAVVACSSPRCCEIVRTRRSGCLCWRRQANGRSDARGSRRECSVGCDSNGNGWIGRHWRMCCIPPAPLVVLHCKWCKNRGLTLGAKRSCWASLNHTRPLVSSRGCHSNPKSPTCSPS
jgi:hypothetical protein